MSDNWHPNPWIESLALARFDIFYLGLVVIGIAVAMFSLLSPFQITSHNGYEGFIGVKESTKTGNGVAGSLRQTLEDYAKSSEKMSLAVDAQERRFRFPRRFREGLWSLLVSFARSEAEQNAGATGESSSSPKDILAGLTAEGSERAEWWDRLHHLFPAYSIDIFRLEFIHADYASPVMRAVVFWVLILGIFIVFIPTLITTYLVLADLEQVIAASTTMDPSAVGPR
jgi:hypothetical protein